MASPIAAGLLRCELPGGYLDEALALHRVAELGPLGGSEEELLLSTELSPAAAVTAVLSRCVKRIGDLPAITREVVRSLLVADRLFLLLKLREITFGPTVSGSLRCPWESCGQLMSLSFSLRDLAVKRWPDPRPTYTVEIDADGSGRPLAVAFRLPNGEDQEEAVALLGGDERLALRAILARCIAAPGPAAAELVAQLPPASIQAIERRMEAEAPAVDLEIVSSCPDCGRTSSAVFDPQDFFFGELRQSVDLLYREVHYLAYHYHWSEETILAMPRDRRRRYVRVLASEMERLSGEA
jgi:hypothetical protein